MTTVFFLYFGQFALGLLATLFLVPERAGAKYFKLCSAIAASMLTAALRHIASDLGMSEDDLGTWLGVIRLGALPVVLTIPLADRIGRRRIFLATLAGASLGTLATAFTQTANSILDALECSIQTPRQDE